MAVYNIVNYTILQTLLQCNSCDKTHLKILNKNCSIFGLEVKKSISSENNGWKFIKFWKKSMNFFF